MSKFKSNISVDKLEVTYLLTHEFTDFMDKYMESYNDRLDNTDKIIFEQYNEFYLAAPIETIYNDYRVELDILIRDYNEEIGFYNRRIGKLFYGSNHPLRQQLYIALENKSLYNGDINFLYYIADELNLQFLKISKLELAFDFNRSFIDMFYAILKDEEFCPIIFNKKYKKMDEEIGELLHVSTGTRYRINKFKSFYIKSCSKKSEGLELKYYDKAKEIKDKNFEKKYILDKLKFDKIFRLEIKANHKKLKYSLDKIGLTDEDLFRRIEDKKLLFTVFQSLIDRVIRFEYKKRTYSLLDFILKQKPEF